MDILSGVLLLPSPVHQNCWKLCTEDWTLTSVVFAQITRVSHRSEPQISPLIVITCWYLQKPWIWRGQSGSPTSLMARTELVLDPGWGCVDYDAKAEVQHDKRHQIKTEWKSEPHDLRATFRPSLAGFRWIDPLWLPIWILVACHCLSDLSLWLEICRKSVYGSLVKLVTFRSMRKAV